jgi:hypothetical protein
VTAPPPEGSGGPPPAPWERAEKRRDRTAIIWSVVAAVVLAVPTVALISTFEDQVADLDLSATGSEPPSGGAEGPTDEGPDAPQDRDDVEVPALDLDELDGTDAEFGQLFTAIDRSERAMLEAQLGIGAAFEGGDPQDDPTAVLDAAAEAAGDGQRELQELRSELAAPVDDEVAREVRDTYLAHLDAWVRYLVAIEGQPDLLLDAEGEEVFLLSIDTTGDAFARVVRSDLPGDLDDDVREVADAIVERGFPERSPDPGDAV